MSEIVGRFGDCSMLGLLRSRKVSQESHDVVASCRFSDSKQHKGKDTNLILKVSSVNYPKGHKCIV